MNKSNEFRGHIAKAVKDLQIPPSDFRLVSLYQYEDILVSILNKFTSLGKKGIGCNCCGMISRSPPHRFTLIIHLEY